jgi:ABC-type multidrug transport system fused ATPase/permease subunit
MRGKDQVDGKLISLDTGNIGDDDMGVKIEFQDVWFRYPTRDVPILNGLSLTVRKSTTFVLDVVADVCSPDQQGAVCGDCRPIR